MKPLEAAGLHTFYGRSHILHGVGLEVNEGEIVALLGRNGAGKTTTLRSIMGLTPAREGSRDDLRPGSARRCRLSGLPSSASAMCPKAAGSSPT